MVVRGENKVDEIFDVYMIDRETSDGKAVDKRSIHSPSRLTQWLGVDIIVDPTDPSVEHVVVRKRDPKCRFIYLHAQNSRAKLMTTRNSLTQIMTYHQVMPVYLDFMLDFGKRSDHKELALKRWLQVTLPLIALTLLGASSTYQIYNIPRGVLVSPDRKKNTSESLKPLSVVQTARQDGSDSHNVLIEYIRTPSKWALDIIKRLQTDRYTLPLYGNTQSKVG